MSESQKTEASRDEATDRALRQIVRVLVMHPIAARAAYRALIREGRAFAGTDEGARFKVGLETSELMARVATAFELATSGELHDDGASGAIPSVLIEAFVHATLRQGFEARMREALCR